MASNLDFCSRHNLLHFKSLNYISTDPQPTPPRSPLNQCLANSEDEVEVSATPSPSQDAQIRLQNRREYTAFPGFISDSQESLRRSLSSLQRDPDIMPMSCGKLPASKVRRSEILMQQGLQQSASAAASDRFGLPSDSQSRTGKQIRVSNSREESVRDAKPVASKAKGSRNGTKLKGGKKSAAHKTSTSSKKPLDVSRETDTERSMLGSGGSDADQVRRRRQRLGRKPRASLVETSDGGESEDEYKDIDTASRPQQSTKSGSSMAQVVESKALPDHALTDDGSPLETYESFEDQMTDIANIQSVSGSARKINIAGTLSSDTNITEQFSAQKGLSSMLPTSRSEDRQLTWCGLKNDQALQISARSIAEHIQKPIAVDCKPISPTNVHELAPIYEGTIVDEHHLTDDDLFHDSPPKSCPAVVPTASICAAMSPVARESSSAPHDIPQIADKLCTFSHKHVQSREASIQLDRSDVAAPTPQVLSIHMYKSQQTVPVPVPPGEQADPQHVDTSTKRQQAPLPNISILLAPEPKLSRFPDASSAFSGAINESTQVMSAKRSSLTNGDEVYDEPAKKRPRLSTKHVEFDDEPHFADLSVGISRYDQQRQSKKPSWRCNDAHDARNRDGLQAQVMKMVQDALMAAESHQQTTTSPHTVDERRSSSSTSRDGQRSPSKQKSKNAGLTRSSTPLPQTGISPMPRISLAQSDPDDDSSSDDSSSDGSSVDGTTLVDIQDWSSELEDHQRALHSAFEELTKWSVTKLREKEKASSILLEEYCSLGRAVQRRVHEDLAHGVNQYEAAAAELVRKAHVALDKARKDIDKVLTLPVEGQVNDGLGGDVATKTIDEMIDDIV